MTIGWAIVSTGRHPDRKMAPAINQAANGRLVAVYSRQQSTAEAFAQKHGARRAYTDLAALLKDPEVDAVYVASPNSLHAPYTVQAAGAKKHVLCEKPLALTVKDAVEAVRTCRKADVRFGTAFHLRHHPGHQRTRELVQGGAVGTVALMTAMWGGGTRGMVRPAERTGREGWWMEPEMAGAGAMMSNGVHSVDLLRYTCGKEVSEVCAVTDGQTAERPLDDLGGILLRYEDGAIGNVITSRRTPDPRNDLNVYGSDGRVSVLDSLSMTMQGTLEVSTARVNERASYGPDENAMYARMVEAFGRAVERGEEPNASGVDGLRVVEITVAFIESAKTGRAVRIEHPRV